MNKTKSARTLLPWLSAIVLVLLLVLVLHPVTAYAQAAAPAGAAVVVSTPWYADGTVISSIIAAVMAIFGVWSHTEKTTAQKITESLVVGIEQATKLPKVAAAEAEIKAKIQSVASDYGVQPLLDRIVQDIT
ncbi:MAG TPA: hypothetical protein VL357_03085 [Rariglobus sp.]|jgi:hypothetical protein|nr:hypothetical protein [Rariglobus sp.]